MNTRNLLLYFARFCARSNPIPQTDEEKPTTKNFAEFHSHCPLLPMYSGIFEKTMLYLLIKISPLPKYMALNLKVGIHQILVPFDILFFSTKRACAYISIGVLITGGRLSFFRPVAELTCKPNTMGLCNRTFIQSVERVSFHGDIPPPGILEVA